jgi:hypothetical protein
MRAFGELLSIASAVCGLNLLAHPLKALAPATPAKAKVPTAMAKKRTI